MSLINRKKTGILLVVLWFGALWGALEATLGGLLHVILPPTYPGKIMLGVAVSLMVFAVRRTGKVWLPLGMALVAAPLKLFSAMVFALPISAPAVLNPAFSILAQGAAVALLLVIVHKRIAIPLRFGLIGAGAGALQTLLFVGLVRGPGMFLYPSLSLIEELGIKYPYWALTAKGIGNFLTLSVPYSVIAAGLAAAVVGFLPFRVRTQFKPAFFGVGTALCLAIFFLASWFI